MGWTDRFPSWIKRSSNEEENKKSNLDTTTSSLFENVKEYVPIPSSSSSSSSDLETASSQIDEWRKQIVEMSSSSSLSSFMSSSNLSSSSFAEIPIPILMGTSFVVGLYMGRKVTSISHYWKRMINVQDIPSQYFSETIGTVPKLLRGRIVSVSDGDTVRFLHAPTIFHSSTLPKGSKLSELTLPLRLATIDTPEVAKFGKPSQPFGDDAKKYLQSLIENRIVHVQLLTRDQYGRAVVQIQYRKSIFLPFWIQYPEERMLQAGLAEVYQGSGAVYGPKGKQKYLEMEQTAKENKRGMWSQGEQRESAAEFKARMKQEK